MDGFGCFLGRDVVIIGELAPRKDDFTDHNVQSCEVHDYTKRRVLGRKRFSASEWLVQEFFCCVARITATMYFRCISNSAKRFFYEQHCEIIETKLEGTQCGFRSDRSITDQIFTLPRIFEKSSKYAKYVRTCFVELQKTYDRIPRENVGSVAGVRWWRPPVTGRHVPVFLLNSLHPMPAELSHNCSPWVLASDKCVLSPLIFILYMIWIESIR